MSIFALIMQFKICYSVIQVIPILYLLSLLFVSQISTFVQYTQALTQMLTYKHRHLQMCAYSNCIFNVFDIPDRNGLVRKLSYSIPFILKLFYFLSDFFFFFKEEMAWLDEYAVKFNLKPYPVKWLSNWMNAIPGHSKNYLPRLYV